MKNTLKNSKGVTLVILLLTILIIAILTGIAISHVDTGKDIRDYNYMCADIELLEGKVQVYYSKNGTIPIVGTTPIANIDLGGQASSKDNANYYKIDLSKLYNVSLNYGGGTIEDKNIYVINEQSHNIYYLKGTEFENTIYYRKIK